MASWAEFEAASPALAAFGRGRLSTPPAYLATIRAGGMPRVHPVTPIIGSGRLFLFMEPTSPKGRDLRERRRYAMHNGVPDNNGSGGEFWISGEASFVSDPAVRAMATEASSYAPEERYVLFELGVEDARGNGYGDVPLPSETRWRASR
jgi:hypothetical protein